MSWSRSMNWFGRRKPRRAARRASNSFKPSLEQLEDRTLLSAAIWTNRPDYLPGQIATITGSGFRVGETVDVHVVNLTSGAQYAPWSVTDGGAGDLDGKADQTIQTAWTVPDNALHSTLRSTFLARRHADRSRIQASFFIEHSQKFRTRDQEFPTQGATSFQFTALN